MSQHDYTIANQGFPATRSDINNALSAIATNNSGTSAPSTQYAGQFWIDTTSSTWTMYIHDGTDDIQFATIDTSANTVNFTDSALDVVTDTTPQLGGDLDLNSNDITGTGDINITGDITATNLSGTLPVSNLSGLTNFKNTLINGDMSIAQRGTSTSGVTTASYNTVDRWQNYISSLGTWTVSQDTDVPSGQGFVKSLKLDCTVADASPASNDVHSLIQKIEGQNLQYLKKGTSNAESLTISFWVKSNKTGTYTCELFDADNTRYIGKTYTIDTADTWEKKTITYDGDTTGTLDNDNAESLSVILWLGAGSDFTGGTFNNGTWGAGGNDTRVSSSQVNLADNTANEWYITGVQLEAGEVASDFEFLPHDVNLQRCLRYFERYDNTINGVAGVPQGLATVDVANRAEINLFYTRKRANPTITGSSDVEIGTMANTYLTGTAGPNTYVGTGLYGANLFYGAIGNSPNTLSGINYIALPSGKFINIDAEL